MAQKRMFTMKIVDSDAFLELPLTSQCLYFHLNMRADDDGFVGNPRRIMRLIGASDGDMKMLIEKRFVLYFNESGIIVIKHWRMHNTLSAGRYHETQYLDEKNALHIKENGAYTLGAGKYLDDAHLAEISKRQAKDEQKTNTDLDLDKDLDVDISNIVGHLNEVAGTNYKPSSKSTRALISSKAHQGFKTEDFIKAIDNKASAWKNTEWEKYLRPSTLFGPKFEEYVNEKPKAKNADPSFDLGDIERRLSEGLDL